MVAKQNPMRILCIDSDEAFLRMLRVFLRQEGYEVETAANAREGLDLMMRMGFHLVIFDFALTGMDGLAFAQIVAKTWPWQEMMLHSAPTGEVRKKFLVQQGVKYFLEKPAGMQDLEAAIRNTKVARDMEKGGAGEMPPFANPIATLYDFRRLSLEIWRNPQFLSANRCFLDTLERLITWQAAVLLADNEQASGLFVRAQADISKISCQKAAKEARALFSRLGGREPELEPHQMELPETCGNTELPTQDVVWLPMMSKEKLVGLLGIYPEPNLPLTPLRRPTLYFLVHHFTTLLQAIDELNIQSMLDPLTRLHTPRFLHSALDRALTLAKRNGTQVGLMVMGLDEFKRINDRHGYSVGDSLLEQVSILFAEHIRKSDLLVRYEGDQFAVLMPDVKESNVIDLANRLRKAVQSTSFHCGELELRLTLSVGYALNSSETSFSPTRLTECAVKALYRAKKDSGTQVLGWRPENETSARPGLHQILLVDDDPQIHKLIGRMLSADVYDITGAATVSEAMQHLQAGKEFEVLITDLSMPGQDGVDLLRLVREIDPLMTRMVISGQTVKQKEDQLRAMGAYSVLAKPFSPAELRNKVTQAVEHHFAMKRVSEGKVHNKTRL